MRCMTEEWRPLGVEPEDEEYFALHEEVTDWLRKSLIDWVSETLADPSRGVYPVMVNYPVITSIERVLRVPVTKIVGSFDSAEEAGPALLRHFEQLRRPWQLLDYLLSIGGQPKPLARILHDASSVWTVDVRLGRTGLIRRITDGAAQAVKTVTSGSGNAGKRLASAFDAIYGVAPDPSKAYGLAIKAVEDATIPVVSPANTKATLGTVIRDFKNAPTFRLPHNREHGDAPTHTVVLGMMQMLWVGQTDRHGGPASVGVPPVSQSEAEAAVMLAVPLVEWFTSGKVKKGK